VNGCQVCGNDDAAHTVELCTCCLELLDKPPRPNEYRQVMADTPAGEGVSW
jgi:hypothetical protein